jgi:hypothetical protein
MAVKYLRCGKDEKGSSRNPDMDFEYDESFVKSSFMSDYKIDLDDAEMHWWKFCNLLQGLTDSCILNRVRDIRNYDLSTILAIQIHRQILLHPAMNPRVHGVEPRYAELRRTER